MWNPNLSTSSSQRSPRLYSVKVTTASVTLNKSYTSFRFGELTQEKPALKFSSPILVTLISPCCPSLTSITLQLQPGQSSVVQTWLTRHCHHTAPCPSTVAPFSPHHVAGPLCSSLTLLSFVPPRDLLFHCQWDAAFHFAPPVIVAYFPHLPWTCSHFVLVSNCNFFRQHRAALEGLHSTTSVTPFLDTSILCSDHKNLPKLVPGICTSLCQRFSLKELEYWLWGESQF